MTIHYPPLSRDPDEQPRIDGSVHDEQLCYECGESSRTERLDPIIFYNPASHRTEYRFACADIGPCSMRKRAMGLRMLPVDAES